MSVYVVVRDRSFLFPVQFKGIELVVESYSFETIGGPKDATITAYGTTEALWELLGWLRHEIIIKTTDQHRSAWWGCITEVKVSVGALTFGVSLEAMANKVRVIYTANDVTGEGAVRYTTPWTSHDESQLLYGVKEWQESASNVSEQFAEAMRDTILNLRNLPQAVVEQGGAVTATIYCKGWFDLFDWRYWEDSSGLEVFEPDYLDAASGVERFEPDYFDRLSGIEAYVPDYIDELGGAEVHDPGELDDNGQPTEIAQDIGNTEDDKRIAQSLMIASAQPFRVRSLTLDLRWVYGQPTDGGGLEVQLWQGAGEEPVTLLRSAVVFPTTNAYTTHIIPFTSIDLQPGTKYWIVMQRPSYFYQQPRYAVRCDASKSYPRGKLYVHGEYYQDTYGVYWYHGANMPDMVFQLGGEEVRQTQTIGAVAGQQGVMQGFRITQADGYKVYSITAEVQRIGNPLDSLVMAIWQGETPTTQLAWSYVTPTDSMAPVTAYFNPVHLYPDTPYWLVIGRFNAATISSVSHFAVDVDASMNKGYARGDLRIWTGSAWVARVPDAQLGFQVGGDDPQHEIVFGTPSVQAVTQGFRISTTVGYQVNSFAVAVGVVGTPQDSLVMELRSGNPTPTSTVLRSATLALTDEGEVATAIFEPITLEPTVQYWLYLRRSGTLDAANAYTVTIDTSIEQQYARGVFRLWNGSAYNTTKPDGLMGFQVGGAEVEQTQALGDTLAHSRVAQGFAVINPNSAGWYAESVTVEVLRHGNPSDDVRLTIWEGNGAPSVAVTLQRILESTPDHSSEYQVVLPEREYLLSGKQYWIVLERTGAIDPDHYYEVTLDTSIARGYNRILYPGGPDLGRFVVGSNSSWISRVPDGQMGFRVQGSAETTYQIATIASRVGQFLTGVDSMAASGVWTTPFRNGDSTALTEINALLQAGTATKRRLLALVTPERMLRVYLEPESGQSDYAITKDGTLYNAFNAEVEPEMCPYGIWVRLKNVLPVSVDPGYVRAVSPFFIEQATYNARDNTLTWEPRGSTSTWNIADRD